MRACVHLGDPGGLGRGVIDPRDEHRIDGRTVHTSSPSPGVMDQLSTRAGVDQADLDERRVGADSLSPASRHCSSGSVNPEAWT